MGRVIRVETLGLCDRDRHPVDQHQLGHRVEARHANGRAGGTDVVGDRGVWGSDDPHERSGVARLIGPCRYSIAGYASLYVCDASRSLSAASSAIPTVQP